MSFREAWEGAKGYIMQGLSYRLEPYEGGRFKEYTIEFKGRVNYGQDMEKKLIENYA